MISKTEFETLLAKDPVACASKVFADALVIVKDNERLRKNADPRLMEPVLLSQLRLPVTVQNAEPLQVGAMLSLVAAFDRKIDREVFVETATSVTSFFESLGRLSIAESVKHMMEKDVFTKAKIEEAASELIKYADADRAKIIKALELVVQCSTSDEKIQ